MCTISALEKCRLVALARTGAWGSTQASIVLNSPQYMLNSLNLLQKQLHSLFLICSLVPRHDELSQTNLHGLLYRPLPRPHDFANKHYVEYIVDNVHDCRNVPGLTSAKN